MVLMKKMKKIVSGSDKKVSRLGRIFCIEDPEEIFAATDLRTACQLVNHLKNIDIFFFFLLFNSYSLPHCLVGRGTWCRWGWRYLVVFVTLVLMNRLAF